MTYSECMYQMNEFHPSQFLISLAPKPRSVRTVEDESEMLQFVADTTLSSTNHSWGNVVKIEVKVVKEQLTFITQDWFSFRVLGECKLTTALS